MDKFQKNELISSLKIEFNDTTTVVVAYYAGLKVSDLSSLRVKMRNAGGAIKVVKNRLAKLATVGTTKECINGLLEGPTLLALSKDPIVAAKVINDFSKENQKLQIIGGAFGDHLLDIDGVKSLATMPSLDELRAKILGLITAPARKIACVTVAPATQLARVVSTYANKTA